MAQNLWEYFVMLTIFSLLCLSFTGIKEMLRTCKIYAEEHNIFCVLLNLHYYSFVLACILHFRSNVAY